MKTQSDRVTLITNLVNTAVRLACLVTVAGAFSLPAASIPVPNASFESQVALGQPFGINFAVDSWQRNPNPGYPEGGGFFWFQTSAAFDGTTNTTSTPYTNLLGHQAAYVLSFTGAGFMQDNQTTDWSGATNGLNATYDVGMAYNLTVGLFGKGMTHGYSSLNLSLYYRNNTNGIVPISTTAVVYDTNTFSPAGPFQLIDYSVTVPTVQSGDAWAGKNIGILISSGNADFNQSYWDMDNVRLTGVPEPGTIGLATLGIGGLVLLRRGWRRQI